MLGYDLQGLPLVSRAGVQPGRRVGERHRLFGDVGARREVARRGDDIARLDDRRAIDRPGPRLGGRPGGRGARDRTRVQHGARRRIRQPGGGDGRRVRRVGGADVGLVRQRHAQPAVARRPGGGQGRAGGHRLERRPAELLLVRHRHELRGGELALQIVMPEVDGVDREPAHVEALRSGERRGAESIDRRRERHDALAHLEAGERMEADRAVDLRGRGAGERTLPRGQRRRPRPRVRDRVVEHGPEVGRLGQRLRNGAAERLIEAEVHGRQPAELEFGAADGMPGVGARQPQVQADREQVEPVPAHRHRGVDVDLKMERRELHERVEAACAVHVESEAGVTDVEVRADLEGVRGQRQVCLEPQRQAGADKARSDAPQLGEAGRALERRVEPARREQEARLAAPRHPQGDVAGEDDLEDLRLAQRRIHRQPSGIEVDDPEHVHAERDDCVLRVRQERLQAPEDEDADGRGELDDDAELDRDDGLGSAPSDLRHRAEYEAVARDGERGPQRVQDLRAVLADVLGEENRVQAAAAQPGLQHPDVHRAIHRDEAADAGQREAEAQRDREAAPGDDQDHREPGRPVGHLRRDQADRAEVDHALEGELEAAAVLAPGLVVLEEAAARHRSGRELQAGARRRPEADLCIEAAERALPALRRRAQRELDAHALDRRVQRAELQRSRCRHGEDGGAALEVALQRDLDGLDREHARERLVHRDLDAHPEPAAQRDAGQVRPGQDHPEVELLALAAEDGGQEAVEVGGLHDDARLVQPALELDLERAPGRLREGEADVRPADLEAGGARRADRDPGRRGRGRDVDRRLSALDASGVHARAARAQLEREPARSLDRARGAERHAGRQLDPQRLRDTRLGQQREAPGLARPRSVGGDRDEAEGDPGHPGGGRRGIDAHEQRHAERSVCVLVGVVPVAGDRERARRLRADRQPDDLCDVEYRMVEGRGVEPVAPAVGLCQRARGVDRDAQ